MSADNDLYARSFPFVERAYWRTDVVTHLVMLVGFAVTSVALAWLADLPAYAGPVLALVGWGGFVGSDIVQAWVWRRGRR